MIDVPYNRKPRGYDASKLTTWILTKLNEDIHLIVYHKIPNLYI